MKLLTKDQILNFVEDNKVCTDGAWSAYIPTIKEVDDGDEYIEVVYPFWTHNQRVVATVLNIIVKAHTIGGDIYCCDGEVHIHFYMHVCDPEFN